MNQKFMLFLFSFCFCSLFGQSQIVSTESFDAVTYPPTGWSIKPAITPQNLWRRQTSPTTNPTTTSHSGAAVSRFARNAAAGTKQLLITRALDYTNRGTNAASLDFWMYRDSLAAANFDSIRVWVNSTDTLDASAIYLGTIARNRSISIPDTQAINGWYHFTYAVPVTFTGNTTTRFIFEATSETTTTGQGSNIFIDDVSFDEFPPICTGTPNVGTIVPSTSLICGGTGSAVLSLTAPIIGLTGITYSWEQGSSATGPWTSVGTNAPTCNTGTITATTYYQCTVNCSFSSLSFTTATDSIVVSANTPPVVAVTPATVVYCAGTSGVELIATGATSYSWSPATGLNSTAGDTVIASPAASTQYVVTGTDAIGCTNTATANVTFNAGPAVNITANPNDTVCVGSQVVLTSVAAPTTGNIYLWSDGTTTRRDTIIVTANITLSVTVTNAQGCSLSDTVNVVANPPSVANFGYNATANTYHFSDSSVTATGWAWTFGDGNGSSNQHPTYTYSTPGTYTVTLVITGPCGNDTMTQMIVVGPESINNLDDADALTFYPNPVNDFLNLNSTAEIISHVSVKNYIGQQVLAFDNKTNSPTITLTTSSLAPGVYFAEVVMNGHSHPIKFIKK